MPLINLQVLVGRLQSCPHTGRLQLVDRTGKVQCVITSTNTTHPGDTQEKLCNFTLTEATSSCRSRDDSISSQHHILPCVLDKVIRVDKFSVVVEEFVHDDGLVPDRTNQQVSDKGRECTTNKGCSRDWRCVYVVFSMVDTVVLCKRLGEETGRTAVKRSASSAGLNKPGTVVAGSSDEPKQFDKQIKVSSNHLKLSDSSAVESIDSFKPPGIHTTVDSTTGLKQSNMAVQSSSDVKQPVPVRVPDTKQPARTRTGEKQKTTEHSCVRFVVRHVGSLQQDSANSKHLSFFVDIELLDCQELMTRSGKDFSMRTAGVSSVSSKSSKHSVSLCFRQDVVKWYPVLHPGCGYSLSLAMVSDLSPSPVFWSSIISISN